jgi:hypothetical protein
MSRYKDGILIAKTFMISTRTSSSSEFQMGIVFEKTVQAALDEFGVGGDAGPRR